MAHNEPKLDLPLEIVLQNVRLMLFVGIHLHEREKPQPVIVNVAVRGKIPATPRSIADVLDYAAIRNYVVDEWPKRGHTDLLETLAIDLLGMIFKDARVEAADVALMKPDAFPETEGAGIRLRLTRTEWQAVTAGR